MTLFEQFTQAQADSKNLAERPDNLTLLKIYALFKQGSSGDATGDRSAAMDFVARAKWDAWQALAGVDQAQAQADYVALIEQLKSA